MKMSDVYCVKQVNLTLTKVSYSQTLTTAPPTAAMTSVEAPVEALHIIPTKLQLLLYGKFKKTHHHISLNNIFFLQFLSIYLNRPRFGGAPWDFSKVFNTML